MGKKVIYTYECDICEKNFKSPNSVLHLRGDIINGDDQVIFSDTKELQGLICRDCFIKSIIGKKNEIICTTEEVVQEEKEKEEELEKIETPEYSTLRKIINEEDEETFINFLGHISRENFSQVYNKSLIDHYYPIEDCVSYNLSNCFEEEIKLIYKAFAGIPQIKISKAYVSDDGKIAFIEKSILEI